MVAIVRTEWSGTSGGPGLTQFASMGGAEFTSGTAQLCVNAVRSFWASMASDLPDELRLTVLPVVDIYNDATGELTDSHVAPISPTVLAGTAAGSYVGGAGAKITWNTGVIRNGRRVRGTTFIVPVATSIFTATGTVGTTFLTSTNTAAGNLIAAYISAGSPMGVWSRPTGPGVTPARTGALSGIISGSTATKSAILRGRRD